MAKVTVDMRGFNPPTTTAQEKKVAIVAGRPVFYKPKKVREAEAVLHEVLMGNDPKEPLKGPIKLTVQWQFEAKTHKPGTYRTTRPDTDNLQKLLKDVLTSRGWWRDDAQVVIEHVSKIWAADPGLIITAEEIDNVIENDTGKQAWEWCHDCKEYDQKAHCCHRWTGVIRETVKELEECYKERRVAEEGGKNDCK